MRWTPAALALALLLASACSSADAPHPALHLAALRARLVGGTDVELPGYTIMTPAGEERTSTATAVRYFTAAGGFRQLTVTLVAAANPTAARAATTTAVTTVIDSLRTPRMSAVPFGRDGRRVSGRTKGYGALQDSVFFDEGSVSVSVTLSSGTPGQPTDLVTDVARAQDGKLRQAA